MLSTLYVHSDDDDARSAFWAALTAADPSDYFCDSLRMVALVFGSGIMTPTFVSLPPPSPPSPPPPSSAYTCSAGQCIASKGGFFSNATACHASCFTRYACNQSTQQ